MTGFADVESAVAAIKLGAVDYKSKPLIGDDLVHAVETLVSTVSPRIGLNVNHPGDRWTATASALKESVRQLAEPSIHALEFLLVARSFRRLSGGLASQPGTETKRCECTPQETALAINLLDQLAEALSRGAFPSLDRVAKETLAAPSHINYILKVITSSDFCQCRRALRIRPCLAEVASSHEQIAQIAYRHGYQWPGQLDRDFKATLLLTPNAFRRMFLRLFPSSSSRS